MAHSFSLQERKIYIPAVSCNERWYSGNLNMPYKKLAEVSKYFCGNGNFTVEVFFCIQKEDNNINFGTHCQSRKRLSKMVVKGGLRQFC